MAKNVFYRCRKLSTLTAAVALAVGLLVLVAAAEPAGAAFPGTNGLITFERLRDGTWEIYVMDPDGSVQTNLTNNQAQDDIDPAFSPDGKKIAFSSNRDSSYSAERSSPISEIYVMDSDGSNPTRLTTNQAWDSKPSFSPDGKKIVFKSDLDGSFSYNNYAIYVMDSDGSNLTRLTNNQAYNNDDDPVFSPDGEKIAFTSERDGNPAVYVMNSDGTEQTRLTNTRGDADPAFSPDGKKIAFTSSRDRQAGEIYVMNADGTQQTRLTYDTHHNDIDPAFSPDGKKIAFTHQYRWDPHHTMISAINVDSTEQINLTTIPPGGSPRDFEPDWGRTPDNSEECTISGTEGNDVLQGTSSDDVICGLGGNDTLKGLGGNDILRGGSGKDTLKGGEGDDTLDGGEGTDRASYGESLSSGVKASLTTNSATGEGSDTLKEIEDLTGSHHPDELEGSEGPNRLHGNGGADTVFGLGGADILYGWSGRDTLKGGSGNDKLTGDSGADRLFGEEDDDALDSKDGVEGNDSLDGGLGTNSCTTDPTEAAITNCQ